MGDIEDFKEKVQGSDYDNMKNGHEIYNSPNGMRFNIKDQEGAELVAGKAPSHDDALKTNEQANNGMNVLQPMSEGGQDFFDREQGIADNAKKDAAHQEALDSNAKANEGTNVLQPMSEGAQDFFDREQGIADNAKKDAAHQEALDSNAKANEGTNVLQPMSPNAQDFFSREQGLVDEAKLLNEESKEFVENRLEDLDPEKPEVNEDPVIERLKSENTKLKAMLEENKKYIGDLKADVTKLSNELTLLMEQINSEGENNSPSEEILSTDDVLSVEGEVIGNETKKEIPLPTEPNIINGQFEEEPVTPPTQEANVQSTQQSSEGSDARVAELEAQLRELRGENTPEQRSAALAAEILKLEEKLQEEGSLTDAEKVRYIELTMEKKDIDKGLVQAGIENNKSTERKEKLIKRIAFVAGAGLALATPAVGVAAIVAVTLGGRFVGNTVKKASNNLMSKSTSLKYESRKEKTLQELNELDKKIKRNEWWSKRLGEASAVIIGGSTGYGIGSTFQSIFGWGASSASVAPDTNSPIDLTSQTSVSHSPVVPEGSIELPTGTGGAETLNEGVLVNNGRIDLPGSAWNGNLAQTNAQDVLQGGALNPSNYTGGIHEMAPNFLERDLIANGITRPELMNNLDTSQIHQLLNRYFSAVQGGNTQPDLAQILESIKPGVSEALIK